ncbi:MAG: Carboxylesterase [Verrucomicrobiaceae bacterium]|nr:Carboxylesterase [Verrucomicrobiaceae bacterium]
MKHLLFLAFAVASSSFAQDLAAQKQKVLEVAAKSQVEVRLDQSYADNSNPKQMLDLYLPRKRNSEKPLPVVAFIHGGGWIHGDRIGAASGAIQMARTGDYVAVSVGYRLTNEAHWPEQIYDCKAAIRWIRGQAKEFNLDADHIAVWGSSAGGHLSSLLGTSGDVKELEGREGSFITQSSRVTCVVNLCGPQDFTKALMFDKEGKPVVQDDAVIGLLGGTYEEKHAEAIAASPLTYVTKDDPPFLNAQGTKDQRVAYANAEWIHAALNKTGVPSLLIPITDGGHGSVSNPELNKRAVQFVGMHLRGIKAEIDTSPIPALPEKKK